MDRSLKYFKQPLEAFFGLRRFCLIGLSGLLSLGSLCCGAATSIDVPRERFVKVYGEIQIHQADIMPDGKQGQATQDFVAGFEAVVGRKKWQLTWDNPDGSGTRWYCDGTNVLSKLWAASEKNANATNVAKGLVARTESVPTNGTIYIEDTDHNVPRGSVSLNLPWLAFCSGNFLREQDRIIPLPVVIIGHTPDAFAYTDKTTVFEDQLGLPKEIDLFTSAARFGAAVKEFWKNKGIAPKTPFEDGLRKFHYAVTDSTNFDGWQIPLRLEFSEELPRPFFDTSVRMRGSCNVRLLSNAAPPEGVFGVDFSQTIIDRRFKHETKPVNSIIYKMTNGAVLPLDDPSLVRKFESAVQRAPSRGLSKTLRRRWAIAFLAVVVGFPGIAWVYLKLRPDNK